MYPTLPLHETDRRSVAAWASRLGRTLSTVPTREAYVRAEKTETGETQMVSYFFYRTRSGQTGVIIVPCTPGNEEAYWEAEGIQSESVQ